MTYSNYTRNILNIKDENITFEENCLEITKIKNTTVKIFHGKLTYTPTKCPHCGVLYEKDPETIIKYGFKKNCKIKIDKVANYNTILSLDKQRFLCKYCNKTFTAETNLIAPHKQISNNVITTIKLKLMQKGSEKDIARRNNVSTCFVNRILNSISEDKIIKNNGHLPSGFAIDEFKATKDTISKMAFIIVNQDNNKIFDITNSRLSNDIKKYFEHYSLKERDKVKFITMDLYKPYYILMKKLFRNAILIPDRFHIIIQVRNALDKTRIKLCYKSNPNYNKFKKYWKLILKDKRDLDKENKKYQKCFKKEMSQYDIVKYLLNTNDTLKNTYEIYQKVLYAVGTRNKDIFKSVINGKNKAVSSYMKKSIKTLKNMEKYIYNALDYEYSNGIVEGTNNLIKQIKHTACGYRKFKHLKARVMLIKGLLNPIQV